MQSSSITTVTHKLDTDEMFALNTTSDYAGVPVTIRVEFIEATSRNDGAPSKLLLSGTQLRKDGTPGKVWTERKLFVTDGADELAQFPAAILAEIGL